MKETALILAFCLTAAAPVFADGTNVLADEKSRESYALGMSLGRNLQQQGVEVDWNLYSRGFKDAQSGGATLLTEPEMRDTMTQLQQKVAARQQQLREAQAAKNQADGAAFLAANKTKPGVVTLPDGLQYRIITSGNGEIPGDNDTVTMNFRGTFVDGTEFDNSVRSGKPLQTVLDRLSLAGWREALKLMKAGSKWELFIPSDLACGQNGMPPRIPPDATLIMEVELLAVDHTSPQPPAAPPAVPGAPLTSDIIKVPSAEEMKKGAQIEIIKPEDAQKLQQAPPPPAK
jgi:FKBP-type peptidyl-prolyl cis-trans isomerase FklB